MSTLPNITYRDKKNVHVFSAFCSLLFF